MKNNKMKIKNKFKKKKMQFYKTKFNKIFLMKQMIIKI